MAHIVDTDDQVLWVTDVVRAVRECGFLVESVRPDRVVLGGRENEIEAPITVESHLLSGDLIRRLFKPRRS